MSSCYSFSGRVFFSDLVYLLFLVMVIFKKFGSNFRNWPGPHFHIHVFPNLTTFNDMIESGHLLLMMVLMLQFYCS